MIIIQINNFLYNRNDLNNYTSEMLSIMGRA